MTFKVDWLLMSEISSRKIVPPGPPPPTFDFPGKGHCVKSGGTVSVGFYVHALYLTSR